MRAPVFVGRDGCMRTSEQHAAWLGAETPEASPVEALPDVLTRMSPASEPSTREALTERQAEMLGVVVAFVREHGFAPTVRELARLTGIVSTNAVSDVLRVLERKGYLRRSSYLARGLVVTGLRGVVLDTDVASRCAVLLRELLDGPLGDDLVLDVAQDADLRALLTALDEGAAR